MANSLLGWLFAVCSVSVCLCFGEVRVVSLNRFFPKADFEDFALKRRFAMRRSRKGNFERKESTEGTDVF
ncbi:MAG: hypothetical protein AAFR25_08030 [Cyanobacteria bacterium J06629_19]